MPILFLLFVIVPIIEISLFIQIGSEIGGLNTLILVIATAALGAFFVKREGIATLQSAQNKLQQNQVPAKELITGAGLLVAGVLLITPGFMTDILGFLLILPVTRAWFFERVIKRSNIKFAHHQHASHFNSDRSTNGANGKGSTFDGEYTDRSREESQTALSDSRNASQVNDEKKL